MTDPIISQEGYDKLKIELDNLIKVKRKDIAVRIQTAKDMGDLSENAEYSDAKDAQAFNEGRIAEINQMIKNVTIVKNGNQTDTIGMGSNIVARSKGNEKTFTIVSFNEADPINGKISNESPLGEAFLEKKKGDKVVVETPKGEVEYEILNIN